MVSVRSIRRNPGEESTNVRGEPDSPLRSHPHVGYRHHDLRIGSALQELMAAQSAFSGINIVREYRLLTATGDFHITRPIHSFERFCTSAAVASNGSIRGTTASGGAKRTQCSLIFHQGLHEEQRPSSHSPSFPAPHPPPSPHASTPAGHRRQMHHASPATQTRPKPLSSKEAEGTDKRYGQSQKRVRREVRSTDLEYGRTEVRDRGTGVYPKTESESQELGRALEVVRGRVGEVRSSARCPWWGALADVRSGGCWGGRALARAAASWAAGR